MIAYEEPKLQHCNLVWSIQNFQLRRHPTAPIASPEYTLKTGYLSKWSMVLNFCENPEEEIYLSLTLKRCAVKKDVGPLQKDVGPLQKDVGPLHVQCKLVLYLSSVLEIEKEHLFKEGSSVCFDDFSTLDDVIESEDCLSWGSFSIRVEILVKEPKRLTPSYADLDLMTLSNDLKHIYESQLYTDLVIKTDTKKFKVHKCIFIARCANFQCLLRYNMKSKIVKVPKEKAKVVEKLIYFMYTGDIHSFLNDPVLGMADCAEEFGINDLENLSRPDEIVMNTTFVSEICTFKWAIEDFRELSKKTNSSLRSPPLNSEQSVSWHLRIIFHKDHLSLFAEVNVMADLMVCFEASILNSKSEKSLIKETYLHNYGLCGFPSFVDYEYLQSSDLIKNDTLRLQCTLKFSTGIKLETPVNHEYSMSTFVDCCNSYKRLSENILSMYGNQSDVAVLVGNQQFDLHKCILAARSSVFHAMINKNESDIIRISEMRSEDFEIIVDYMYSGILNYMERDMAVRIYSYAKYYNMIRLFDASSAAVLRHMSPDCVCSLLKLAHQYSDVRLKRELINFVYFNADEVLRRAEWQILKADHSLLANEVISAVDRMTAQYGFIENEIECAQEEVV